MDESIRKAFLEAMTSAENCAKLLDALETVLPMTVGPDHENMLLAIEGLRSFAAVMFPDAPEVPQATTQAH